MDPAQPKTEPGGLAALMRVLRAHPVIASVVITCALGGAILGTLLLSPDWSLARRLAGGLVGGAGVGLLITATRMIG
jgi:hypothetical protein